MGTNGNLAFSELELMTNMTEMTHQDALAQIKRGAMKCWKTN